MNACTPSSNFIITLSSFFSLTRDQESSYITGSLLSSLSFESLLTSMMQDIFLVAQNPDDHHLQQCASWAASLLRHSLHSRELQNYDGNSKNDMTRHKPTSQSFSVDSAVMKLSSWLINLDHSVVSFFLWYVIDIQNLTQTRKWHCLPTSVGMMNDVMIEISDGIV